MRLILKPGGITVLLIAIVALGVLAFSRKNAALSGSGETATVITPMTSGTAPSATAAGHTQEQELIPTRELASDKWENLGGSEIADIHDYPCTLPGFPKLRRVTIPKQPEHPWDVQIRQTIPQGIPSGTHLRLRLWARSKSKSPVTIVCEQNTKPYEKLESRDLSLTPDWQQYEVAWTADRNVPANWAQISLQLGTTAGEIDLAGVSLTSSIAAP